MTNFMIITVIVYLILVGTMVFNQLILIQTEVCPYKVRMVNHLILLQTKVGPQNGWLEMKTHSTCQSMIEFSTLF